MVRLSGGVSVCAVNLIVLVTSARSSDCASSVSSVVRGADVVVVTRSKAAGANSSASGGHLSVSLVGLLAVPEVALGRAAGVVVGRAGTEALLLLVLADQEDLHESSEDEEDNGDDRDSKGDSVEAAGSAGTDGVGEVLVGTSADTTRSEALRAIVGVANAKRGVHNAGAGAGAMAGQDGDRDEATNEQDIENDGSEGEEADATKAAGKNHSSDSVQDRDT